MQSPGTISEKSNEQIKEVQTLGFGPKNALLIPFWVQQEHFLRKGCYKF